MIKREFEYNTVTYRLSIQDKKEYFIINLYKRNRFISNRVINKEDERIFILKVKDFLVRHDIDMSIVEVERLLEGVFNGKE